MKTTILLALTLVSLNSFAATVGEDLKGECIYADQSSKRDMKVVDTSSSQTPAPVKPTSTISK